MTAREDALTLAASLDNPLSDQMIANMSDYDKTETIAACLVILGYIIRNHPAAYADVLNTAGSRQALNSRDAEQLLQQWAHEPFSPITRAQITQLTADEARDFVMTAVTQLAIAEAVLAHDMAD